MPSDDDEFYDRTKKKPAVQKSGEQQAVETADTLLSKKDSIIKEMAEKTKLLMKEKTKVVPKIAGDSESGDALDTFMTGLSSQLGKGLQMHSFNWYSHEILENFANISFHFFVARV